MPKQTPSQTVGPFFHYGLIFGGENVLVNELTKGQAVMITGRVLDGDGEPVEDAMLEIWQADAAGIFKHPADPRHEGADPHFSGFGRADTLKGGVYSFKTIKPGKLAPQDAAPYISVRVFSRGMLIHALTRLYFSDEAANDTDPVLMAVAAKRRHTLVAQRQEGAALPEYRFDIFLQGEEETVFFDP